VEESQDGRVRRAQNGDTAAFESLLHEHFDAAYAVALAVTGQPDEAEDACQDAFVRAWERIAQCRDGHRFRGWLTSVVRSVALNRVRARGRRRSVPLPLDLPAGDEGPAGFTLRSELRDRLLQALRTLGQQQRQVLLLYDLEGFRHAEIAEMLGMSEAMSRRHLSDARARMRALLASYAIDGSDHGRG
jgi:RNA polymerase sigma-70 factor (ECF subfamily)